VKKILMSGGALLMGSAVVSKLLGLWRDRLFVQNFADAGQLDFIFAAFRIPDFFFFLLVGGTVATLFLPRAAELRGKNFVKFFSSFFWGVVVFFGILCGVGAIFPGILVKIFATGFDPTAQGEIANLARLLFGSVFLLGTSAVFSAAQQFREKFLSVAIAPILYTGAICVGIFWFAEKFGLAAIGLAAIAGAALHLLANASAYFFVGKNRVSGLGFFWKKPDSAWKNFGSDLAFRTTNNASFQINQSADVWIASFLAAGTVGAFSIGTNLGHALLSIVGLPLASASFPRLSKLKHQHAAQRKIVRDTLAWIFLATIPAAIVGIFWAQEILEILFDLSGEPLRGAALVFRWTVASLPAACAIPVLSRIFMANDDVKTPMKISAVSLIFATGLAAILSLKILPENTAILGLALGTFSANFLSAGLFGITAWKRFFQTKNAKF
jgi:putative peptidoglycan lipid II flippase